MLQFYILNLVAAKSVPYTYTNLPTITRDDHEMITRGVELPLLTNMVVIYIFHYVGMA